MERKLGFLEEYSLTQAFRREWSRKLEAGWMTIHSLINEVSKDKRTDVFYARLMLVELERDFPRFPVLQRLKGGFNRERQKVELREMAEVTK